MTDHAWRSTRSQQANHIGPVAQRSAAPGKRTLTEELVAPIQRKTGGTEAEQAAPTPSGGERALPDQVRGKMESFFRADFSDVRVHEGPQAHALGALGYTQGTDLHFAPGQYDPATRVGQTLLGHELAHVVQQREGRAPATTQAKGMPLNDNPALESEADELGARAAEHEGPVQAKAREHGGGDTCPTCGGAAKDGGCAACQTTAASVVQRQATPAPSPGACHGTNRPAGLAHEAVQAHYTSMIDPTGVREYAIPGSSESGGIGYADIASLGTGAVYEIKPYVEIADGLVQVARYVTAARVACNQAIPWHPGVTYPDTVIPLADGRQLVAKQYNNPGVIAYYIRQRARQPVPVPTREKVIEVLMALGLSLALVAVVIAALADPEPATKLALAGLSVVMIGAVLEAFGLKGPDAPPGSA